MTQAFLNEPTIEAAHEKYLKRWHLESVRSAWNGRKPSLAQFKKRFGADYTKRQAWLAKTGQGTSATALAVDEREDVAQQVAEVLAALGVGNVTDDEPEDTILGSENGREATINKLAALIKREKPVQAKQEQEQPKFVKPENFDELPRNGQVYFFLHRAQEQGLAYAIIPIKRGVAAEAISQIKDDGRSYTDVAADLVQAK